MTLKHALSPSKGALRDAYARLSLQVDLVPVGSRNRPGKPIVPTHITIHNTGNNAAGADAACHARYIKSAACRARRASWHFSVDDKRAVKHLPASEMAYHTGSIHGNSCSIGIEICENRGIDHDAANDRAALLAAVLCFALDLSPDRIVRHKDWPSKRYPTGKHCPRRLIDGLDKGWTWERFLGRCIRHLAALHGCEK